MSGMCINCGKPYVGLVIDHFCDIEGSRKVEDHYRKDDGTDTIDKWAERYKDNPEIFRELMWCLMEKYKDRLGKKDDIKKEVGKIADYAARWAAVESER